MRVLALTGVPGTGKSTVAALLSKRHAIVDAGALAERVGAVVERDAARDSTIVDEEVLREKARGALSGERVVVEGLLAHFCEPDVVVVLRCHPRELRKRLAKRRWSSAKVDENVLAEALAAVSCEVETQAAWELDTTALPPEEAATLVEQLLQGKDVTHTALGPLGTFDWSETLLEGP